MTRYSQRAQWLLLLAVTALALYLSWRIFEPFLPVLLWASVAVIVFHPVQRWLELKTKRPSLSAALSVCAALFIVIIPLLGITTLVARELKLAVTGVQAGMQELIKDPHWGPKLKDGISRIQQHINVSQILEQVSKSVAGHTADFVGGAFGFILNLCFTVFTMFFLFRDGHRIIAGLSDFVPLEPQRTRLMLDRAHEIISASVYGVLVIATLQGLLGGFMFWLLGIRAALVWTVVMILLCTIPIAGAFIVWVPAAIYLAVTGHVTKALILTVWGGVVIGMVDNVLRPRLVGQRTRMHELLVFFSVLGGLQVFGALGILLGPVTMAVTVALFDALRGAEPAHEA